MGTAYCKNLRFFGLHLNAVACKCVGLVVIALVVRAVCLPRFSIFGSMEQSISFPVNNRLTLNPELDIGKSKFLEVPQIIWGLNNQKIAFARACLTARMLNRTLLMPSLSASLFYKEVDLLKPISFDKVFQFEKFNSLCRGFVQLGRHSQVSNTSDVFEIQKGSGRRWTVEKDLEQLRQLSKHPYETIRMVGKHPFLWHDHWPVKDYAKVLECLELVEEISREADKVVSKIREIGLEEMLRRRQNGSVNNLVRYVAVHMRIEKDWMIHCKKLERRLNISEICSSKEQIVERVGNIVGLKTPIVIYLAVADDLLEDKSIVSGWKEGMVAIEKKRLGVIDMYKKEAYLIQSAIDYEVCLRSDVFVGNSFSTFSSLVVLDRSQKMKRMGVREGSGWCGLDARWPSYAYNIQGESKGARAWAANMSHLNLQAISYGSNHISCS
ncbi:UNVERIFIED_CONTAM: O-fucosyltransferase 23 [Sesamum radiatum]|uniref:O-fucosyltransferase family protein n=1 Tax=Sesamum radiatum TaxID=300843 RepID=A0AAW2LUH9_SESRA